MTKKDYVLIAKILNKSEKYHNDSRAAKLRLDFSQALKEENSNFNEEFFLTTANPALNSLLQTKKEI